MTHANVWYTSDLHFGHKNILKYRTIDGVETVEQHDEFLITQWNETVHPDDLVIVLGDFAMGHRDITVPIAGELHGHKMLIPGNHDYVWSGEDPRRVAKFLDLYNEYFEILPERLLMRMHGQGVLYCHMPFKGEGRPPKEGSEASFDDRYQDHAPHDYGQWLVHGHVHDAWQRKDRQINVGVDVWDFKPVNEDTIAEMVVKG